MSPAKENKCYLKNLLFYSFGRLCWLVDKGRKAVQSLIPMKGRPYNMPFGNCFVLFYFMISFVFYSNFSIIGFFCSWYIIRVLFLFIFKSYLYLFKALLLNIKYCTIVRVMKRIYIRKKLLTVFLVVIIPTAVKVIHFWMVMQ